MLKTLSIVIAAATITAPVLAETLKHDGKTYTYTVEQRGGVQVITGEDADTGQPFLLRVGRNWINGHVNGNPVSFSKRSVVKLKPTVVSTEIATR